MVLFVDILVVLIDFCVIGTMDIISFLGGFRRLCS